MAATPRPPKTETLSLRLNPKTKFMLEFIARVERRSVTSAVELAIEKSAESTFLGDNRNYGDGITWKDFWDPDDAIRNFNLILNSTWANYEEELLSSFISDHWPFFYTHSNKVSINRKNIQVLWPRIYEYLDEFTQNRSTSYLSAGKLMQKHLEDANITPPAWPQPSSGNSSAPSATKRSFAADLEDDIPF